MNANDPSCGVFDEAIRTELTTKVLFLQALQRPVPTIDAAALFFNSLRSTGIPVPNFGRWVSSWSELLDDEIKNGFIARQEAVISLTPSGRSHLEALQGMLRESYQSQ